MKYLGIDFGTKKVGLALSDDAGTMGFPHSVVPNDGRLLASVLALIAKENVGAIVMGDSRDYTGKENPVAVLAKAFAKELTDDSGLPVYFESEILTSEEARRLPDGTRVSQGNVDASAAALILSQYLSHDHA